MSVERNYNETFTAGMAAREKQIQQNYRPVISVHKWFARRPGSLFRALVLAEFSERRTEAGYTDGHELAGVCLDPFMGGGTPLIEAARTGLSVIGYDTNPMARWIVERELEDVDPAQLRESGEAVAADIEGRLAALYRTACPSCAGPAQGRYFLWLRHHRCGCGQEHPLLADTMLVSTKLSRHSHEVHLCPSCLAVAEFPAGTRPPACGRCGADYEDGLTPPDSVHQCGCGEQFRVPPQGTIETPCAKLVAIELDCEGCRPGPGRRLYKAADEDDRALVAEAERLTASTTSPYWPTELIPATNDTRRLLRWGYLQWADLFNARQLHGLGLLAARIAEVEEGPIRRALQTCFSDFLRYQNMLCRYDRQALKPTDVFAVHGFPVPRVSCEPALIGMRGTGSGGFRHALAKYERAKLWCREPYESIPGPGKARHRHMRTAPERVGPRLVERPERLGSSGRALLRRGSVASGDIGAETVDMVLTDPPYFANVQYADLMDFCYVWLRRLAPETPFFDTAGTKTEHDAVGSQTAAGVGLLEFTRRLSAVFAASADALKPGGPFVFTYHHNELEAYAPLVVACLDAGLRPTRLCACPSEMRASKHIHGRNAATVDAVFVLRKPPLAEEGNFGEVAPIVRRRVRALRRAGVQVTEADRLCLRHSALAAQAMSALAPGWDADEELSIRLERAHAALAAPPRVTV